MIDMIFSAILALLPLGILAIVVVIGAAVLGDRDE